MLYASDPSDFLIRKDNTRKKYTGNCACEKTDHPRHLGKSCGVVVERDSAPTIGHYTCYDCRDANRKARNVIYSKMPRKKKPKVSLTIDEWWLKNKPASL